jgi:outer membrane protein OmpA-like peptidoglycan-associated protein/WD40 repeat protein
MAKLQGLNNKSTFIGLSKTRNNSLLKKIIYISIALLGMFWQQANSQTFQLLNVDASRFPKVKADIAVTGAGYSAEQLTLKDIRITENGLVKTPTDFRAPRTAMVSTSISLILDVSGSMEGNPLDILKQTALDFIKKLPLNITEVSIASFNQTITLNCDFTHDISRLNYAVEDMVPYGGTDFNNAFLTGFSGAIDIARQGMYRRVVVFITDGLSEASYGEIAQKALLDTTRINCITIGLPISEGLQFITKETGGSFYSDLYSKNEIEAALNKIYNNLQEHTFGTLEWLSDYSCTPLKETVVRLGTQEFHLSHTIPDSLLGTLELSSEMVSFEAGSLNATQWKPILLRGNNIGLNLSGITHTNDSLFGFEKIRFPISAPPNQWAAVNLTFTPRDSIYTLATYTFSQPGCPDKSLEASTQGAKKLVITAPTVGEVFPRKSPISITWKGTNKSTSIDFYYQPKGQPHWMKATSGSRYQQTWEAPPLNDSIRLMGQVTNNLTLANIMNLPITLVDGTVFKNAVFNSDGTELLTQTEQGAIKTWDAATGKLNNVFEKHLVGQAAFMDKFNRVVNASKNNISLFTNRNGMFIKDISLVYKRTLSSFVFIGDKEFYTSSSTYSGNLWDPSLNMSLSDFPGGSNLDAAFSPNGTYLVTRKKESLNVFGITPYKRWYTVELEPGFENAVLHATKNIMAVNYETRTEWYRLNTLKPPTILMNQHFVQFSKSGNVIITTEAINHRFHDVESGKHFYTLPQLVPYTISPKGTFIAFNRSDSLFIHHFNDSTTVLKWKMPQLQQFRFFPESDRMVLLTSDSLQIINFETKQVEIGAYCQNGLVKSMDIAPNEKSIVVTTANLVAVWPILNYFDSDTTPYFQIVSPKPVVKEWLEFSAQFMGTSKEKVFDHTIQNPNQFPVVIDSVFISGANSNYSLVSSSGSFEIPPHGNCPVEVRFSPKQNGSIVGELTVISSQHRLTLKLLGFGLERNYELLTPGLEFNPLAVGSTADSLFPVLCNKGNVPLSIGALMLKPTGNTPFKILNKKIPTQVNPADTFWISAEFNAEQRGRVTSNLFLSIDKNEPILATALLGTADAKREMVLAGSILNAITRKPMAAQIICNELNSFNLVKKLYSDTKGQFAFTIPTDLNYSLTAELNGYFSSSENIDLVAPQTADTLWVELYLTPFVSETSVRLNNIFFESGSSYLLDLSKNELNRLVALMQNNQKLIIEVQGHTDDIGTPDENLLLSIQRAATVKEYMIFQGVSLNRIQIKSYGELLPIASNSSPEGRKANRRVEVRFVQSGK